MHMRLQLSSRVWLIILIGYWGAMFVSTHVPLQLPDLAGQSSDKILHLSAFCILALLAALNAECQFGELRLRHYAILVIVIAAYGALHQQSPEATEYLQHGLRSPTRESAGRELDGGGGDQKWEPT